MDKILVYGNSWSESLQSYFQAEWLERPGVDVHFVSYPNARLSFLTRRVVEHLDETYTHLVLLTIINEAYRKKEIGNKTCKQKYELVDPDPSFSLDAFVSDFTIFGNVCRMVNSNIKIILVLPPLLDLVYKNALVMANAPTSIRLEFAHHPGYTDELLASHTLERYNYILRLKSKEYTWPDKENKIFDVMTAVHSDWAYETKLPELLSSARTTLRESGYLIDGIHPKNPLIHQFWRHIRLLLWPHHNASHPSSINNVSHPEFPFDYPARKRNKEEIPSPSSSRPPLSQLNSQIIREKVGKEMDLVFEHVRGSLASYNYDVTRKEFSVYVLEYLNN